MLTSFGRLWRPVDAADAQDRTRIAILAIVVGSVASAGLFVLGTSAGTTMVPFSIGVVVGLAVVPFPAADWLFAVGLLGTFPLLPPSSLPNLPLGAAVLLVATVRVAHAGWTAVPRIALLTLGMFWALMAIGAALSNWPSMSLWARPVAILGLGLIASALGLMVWADDARRDRWLDGLSIGLLVVAVTALIVFALQYVVPIKSVVDGLITLVGYVRGDAAAQKFDSQNNWVIWGPILTLRSFSPVFPAPTNTGGFIGLAGPLVAARWLVLPPGRSRRVAGLALGTSVAALVITISRSSWVAAAAGVAVVLAAVLLQPIPRRLFAARLRPQVLQLTAIAAVGCVVGGFGLISVGTPATQARITSPLEDPSVTTRIDIDQGAVAAINADLVRGYGLGNWEATLPDKTGKAYVHNVYLEYGGALGILGIGWSVMLVAMIAGAGMLALREIGIGPNAALGAGLILVGTFAAVQFLFDDNLLNPQYTWLLLWVAGGAVMLAARRPISHERLG